MSYFNIIYYLFYYYFIILFYVIINLLSFYCAPRPSSILTFNCVSICEHPPLVQYSIKKNTKKCSRIWKYLLALFLNFKKTKAFEYNFFQFWSTLNIPWGNPRFNTTFGPSRFSRIDVYWIQTNTQTSKEIYIEYLIFILIYYFILILICYVIMISIYNFI